MVCYLSKRSEDGLSERCIPCHEAYRDWKRADPDYRFTLYLQALVKRLKNPWINRENFKWFSCKKSGHLPKWATTEDRDQIKKLYKKAYELEQETGIPHEVDHIIPLKGSKVSGLHVLANLQVLSRQENRAKSNKFD